jgi:2-polyprenyl-3-methyl-5-hydroxy-6-metoxy-1,4-benzoquinol methylase
MKDLAVIDQKKLAQADWDQRDCPSSEEDSEVSYGHLYDADYYQKGCGPVPYDRSEQQWPLVFGRIADEIIRSLTPQRVLDAGCAMGFLVEAFWDRGVHAWGIDISPYAIANVRRDMKPYCKAASITEPLVEKYDLITCIEVLEHMPESDSAVAIGNLTSATDTILFSSTPFDLDEPTHFSVRPTISWLEAFQSCGFCPDILYDASFVAPHAILLRRQPPLPLEVLRAFSEIIRLRHVSIRNENRGNELVVELGTLRAALQSARSEAAQTRESAQTIVQLHEELAEAEKQAHAHKERIGNLQVQLENERKQTQMLREIQQRLMAEADQLRELIRFAQHNKETNNSSENRHELQPPKSTSSEQAERIENSDLRMRLMSLDRRTADHDRSIQSLTLRLQALMQSRTWRALTGAGGLLLRISGRKV